ncbi:transcriptional adapter ADA2 isoform X3 [Physcomitrium patens]|uniref:Transcriptional adapter n=1 Tax=Physcomitrium patens TaxID=3218 RepID=A0A7I4CKU5_PHYPA|nr:transcriptional adapter ADA2-like isoform X3 [Physcomitrium patens]|eukprot:XP_024363193.1 transcriptional adapter ADA2-like isoform X3 [Physcomitrella patens]
MGRSRGVHSTQDDDTAWFGHRSKRRRVAVGGDVPEPSAAGAGEAKKALYHCNYCIKDISGTIRIKCNKCPDFDLCVECFSVGVEITPHKSNHSYRVIDNLSFPLIHPEWNADEEILLLEGVEMYGLGNWGEASEHVGTKTKTQCFGHYMTTYMNSICSPLPDMSHVIGKSKADLLAMARSHQEGKKDGGVLRLVKQEPPNSPSRIKMEDGFEGRSPSSMSTGTLDIKPLLSTPGSEGDDGDGRAGGSQAIDSSGPSGGPGSKCQKTAGGTQGVVHVKESPDNTAAGAAAEDGAQSNRTLGGKKPKPLAEDNKGGITSTDQTGYHAKRQEFEPEYDNEAEHQLADMEFKDNDHETDRELKLRMLHIYISRLDERKRRKNFILERGLLNIKRQQVLDRKRSKEERELYNRSRVFMRYHSAEEHEALLNGLISERKLRQRIEELQEYRMALGQTLAETQIHGSEMKKETELNLRNARESTSYLYNGKFSTHRVNRYLSREKEGEAAFPGSTREVPKGRVGPHLLPIGSSLLAGSGGKSSKRTSASFELGGFPGVDLLSHTEQDLCVQHRLIPAHYLRMKEHLMLESLKSGQVRRSDAHQMFKVDPVKTDRVYELLLSKGWIQGDGPTASASDR